ncbi:MAG: hypothetical protein ACI8XG_000556 [Congregibacter sp.]|jgi:hypothetical protein
MFNKITMALLLVLGSVNTQAAVLKFDTSITGVDMAGIKVTATFNDQSSETYTWASISDALGTSGNNIVDHEGFSGGVTGTNWSLTQQGFTLGNVNAGNIYGAWNFTDSRTNFVTNLKIDTTDTDIMFDTATYDFIEQDTNGSGQGRSFLSEPSGITSEYTDNVQQELYKILEISGLDGTNFRFLADTDKQDGDATAVAVIAVDELINTTNVVAAADSTAVEAILTADPDNAALKTFLENSNNTQATLLAAVNNLDLSALPAQGTISADEEIVLEAAIQVAQGLIKAKLKANSVDAVSGNGDIEVNIERESGKVAIALTVADPDDVNSPLNFTTLINTPSTAFNLNFNFEFLAPTGQLELYLLGDKLFTYKASDYIDTPGFSSIFINDEKYFGLSSTPLKYSLFPGSPASVELSNINITSLSPTAVVPEPSTVLILMSGLMGLVMTRKKVTGK